MPPIGPHLGNFQTPNLGIFRVPITSPPCASGSVPPKGETPRPRSPSSTRKAPRRRKKGAARLRRGKKIKGRKRHIAVDTQGNLLAVIVHSAGIQDRVAARAVLMLLFCRFATITRVFVDGGYTGKLIGWAKDMFGYAVEVVKRSEQHTFKVLPKRWIVERTF
jgi:transposase